MFIINENTMIVKKISIVMAAVCCLLSCESSINLVVENPAHFERSQTIEIPADQLMALPSGKAYIVMDQHGKTVPSQLTYDGKLIFQTQLKAKETLSYMVKTGSPQMYPAQTYGRLIAERKDDFAWENDRVAFRLYGQALIPIDGPSNGIDLWYKRTNDLILDKWYKDDLAGVRSYHADHGEGLDDYKVGRTLGGGMMAPFENDSLVLNENFVRAEVLENGPLRTTFKLIYKDIQVGDKSFAETRTISLDAGSQLTKITQEYGTRDTITVAAGIVKRSPTDDAHTFYTDNGIADVIYEEPANEKIGNIFVGMIFPKGIKMSISNTYTILHPKSGKEETHSHVLAVMTYYPGQSITYYAGYGWDKFGFPSFTNFHSYIKQFSNELEEPLKIKIL
jgi:hypothetical protein